MTMGSSTSGRELDHELYIPFLPDDVALECLLRVSPRSHNLLHNVSQKWRNLVNSTEFYDQRRKEGATHSYLCLLQAAPQTNPEQPPVYCISVLDTSKPRHQWERLPPIPELAHLGLPLFCRLASTPGKLVVIGGWHPTTREPLTTVYIFSFTSWTWHRGANMPTSRSFFACSTISQSHHIIVAGGHDHSKSALASAELYNTSTNSWQRLPNMSSTRDECMGISTSSANFLAIGGYDTSTSISKFINTAEMYNLETNAWTTVQYMCSASTTNAVATPQGVFAFHDRYLVRRCSVDAVWEVVDQVPAGMDQGISAVASAAGFGGGIAVTGPCSGDDEERCRSMVYRFGDGASARRGVWEAVPEHGDFVGATLASCAVEC
ncbi:hypothetical protein M758_6G201100 [Ceratodon purpureus]|nr:hypothetical protein M758_6G201100 [Ceratodon purpureus]